MKNMARLSWQKQRHSIYLQTEKERKMVRVCLFCGAIWWYLS